MLARVKQSDGKILLGVDFVVGSPKFDEEMKELDPTAITWVGSDFILGVPYAVSSDVPSGLARLNFRRRQKQ